MSLYESLLSSKLIKDAPAVFLQEQNIPESEEEGGIIVCIFKHSLYTKELFSLVKKIKY